MPILGEETVTLRRYTTLGGRNAEGYYDDPVATDSSILMSFQPLEGKDLEKLEEGDRQKDTRKGYTVTEIYTGSQHDDRQPDEIIVDSIVYRVHHVEHQRTIIPHFKVLMVRIQESDPGYTV